MEPCRVSIPEKCMQEATRNLSPENSQMAEYHPITKTDSRGHPEIEGGAEAVAILGRRETYSPR